MDVIAELLEGLDMEKWVPELEPLQNHMGTVAHWALLIGPAVMLILGLLYLFLPTKEANRKYGFRTYFGMGSPEAWRFTQKLAGIVFCALGAGLLIAMLVVQGQFGENTMGVMETTWKSLLWQIGLAAAAVLGVSITSAIRYDRNGNRRI